MALSYLFLQPPNYVVRLMFVEFRCGAEAFLVCGEQERRAPAPVSLWERLLRSRSLPKRTGVGLA